MRKLYFFLIFFILTSAIKPYEIHLSFDRLFPQSLYEKTFDAMQKIIYILKYEENGEDRLLGHLIWVQFYLEQLYEKGEKISDGDRSYLYNSLAEIKDRLAYKNDVAYEYAACGVWFINKMQNFITLNL